MARIQLFHQEGINFTHLTPGLTSAHSCLNSRKILYSLLLGLFHLPGSLPDMSFPSGALRTLGTAVTLHTPML